MDQVRWRRSGDLIMVAVLAAMVLGTVLEAAVPLLLPAFGLLATVMGWLIVQVRHVEADAKGRAERQGARLQELLERLVVLETLAKQSVLEAELDRRIMVARHSVKNDLTPEIGGLELRVRELERALDRAAIPHRHLPPVVPEGGAG